MVIINDPVDPDTQVELKPNTSLPQTSSLASITHPDPAIALELLKRDFHSFREQAAKERAEAEAYRVRIAELEKEQSLLRATLEHRNMYNERSDARRELPGPRIPFKARLVPYSRESLTISYTYLIPLPIPHFHSRPPSHLQSPTTPPCHINLIHLPNPSPFPPNH
ncbi:hypothetical protein ACLB2K_026361 [Fragaria x ananassa]